MLKAKLDRIRKNKKGFSLVELIIVIAIMVALIAVMAPNFVKYVQKSRDTALKTAAEDFLSSVKVAYGDPDSEYALPKDAEDYKIEIKVDGGKLSIKSATGGTAFSTTVPTGTTDVNGDSATNQLDLLVAASGADLNKGMGKTDYVYTISITAGPTFKMSDNGGTTA